MGKTNNDIEAVVIFLQRAVVGFAHVCWGVKVHKITYIIAITFVSRG